MSETQKKAGRGIRILRAVIRPFYWHRLSGTKNVQLDEVGSAVFVCNHGELYGPIASYLYFPYHFRPWVTYELTDRKFVTEYLYENNVKRMKWLPNRLGLWLVRHIVAPLIVWVMQSVRCVPVYHGSPRQLMQTFRATIEAMEAGDNILLFPENSATSETHRFVREGASEFFTGFAAIGQLYYNKTGKCTQFIPVYANKKKRRISFGQSVRYDPDRATNEEKERICRELRAELLRMADAQ